MVGHELVLRDELASLRTALDKNELERSDLEIELQAAIEHGDAIEAELALANEQMRAEIAERIRTEVKLQRLLAALGEQQRPLSELMADYQRYESSGEINFRVADAQRCVDAVVASFGDRVHAVDHLDGVTVDLGDGSWFNLRSSNTEPLLRLNVEARTAEDVSSLVSQISSGIAKAP